MVVVVVGGVTSRVGDLAFVWRISDNLCIYLWLDPVFLLIVDFVFRLLHQFVAMHFCGIFVGGGVELNLLWVSLIHDHAELCVERDQHCCLGFQVSLKFR